MSITKAICPKCGAELLVNAADDATICQLCGAPFITAKAIEAFAACAQPTIKEADTVSQPYTVTLRREKDPLIGNKITFLMIIDDRPRPLSDDAVFRFRSEEKQFELPVFITDNEGTDFEGVLTFAADGKDVDILWAAAYSNKTLGVIKSTTNATVAFVEQAGAAGNWGHGQSK